MLLKEVFVMQLLLTSTRSRAMLCLLQNCIGQNVMQIMLTKDAALRRSAAQCLALPWFRGKQDEEKGGGRGGHNSSPGSSPGSSSGGAGKNR